MAMNLLLSVHVGGESNRKSGTKRQKEFIFLRTCLVLCPSVKQALFLHCKVDNWVYWPFNNKCLPLKLLNIKKETPTLSFCVADTKILSLLLLFLRI